MSTPVYVNHQKFIRSVLDKNESVTEMVFKSHSSYNNVLENLTKESGTKYLKQIETEFPEITFDDIRAFININDKYGGTLKTIFTTGNMKLLYCSPSSLRYIYHALIVLKYFQETTCTKIVEVGSGYGGLYLAINHFAPKVNVAVEAYYLVDLLESAELTCKYLDGHASQLQIPYTICDHGSIAKITDTNLFFLSNYCFTAVDEATRKGYCATLLPQCSHGFVTWQTCFGCQVSQADTILQKNTINRMEEVPQSGPPHAKNYYVYF